MTHHVYPTDFTTYIEFDKIFYRLTSFNDKAKYAESLSEEQLMFRGFFGMTVAHQLAYHGVLPKRYITKELLLTTDDRGNSVAHFLAGSGCFPEEYMTEDVLRLPDQWGDAVAHRLAKSGILPEKYFSKELLLLAGRKGETVAYYLAKSDTLPERYYAEEPAILKSAIHILAERGTLPEKYYTKKLLRIRNNNGWTVAHVLAEKSALPEKFRTLEWMTLKISESATTVAHLLAENGTLPEECQTPDILSLLNHNGSVVQLLYVHIAATNSWHLLTPALLAAPYAGKTTVIAKVKKKLDEMDTKTLAATIEKMTRKTRLFLLSKTRKTRIVKIIDSSLNREMEQEVFDCEEPHIETGDPCGEDDNACNINPRWQDDPLGGRDELYEAGRGR